MPFLDGLGIWAGDAFGQAMRSAFSLLRTQSGDEASGNSTGAEGGFHSASYEAAAALRPYGREVALWDSGEGGRHLSSSSTSEHLLRVQILREVSAALATSGRDKSAEVALETLEACGWSVDATMERLFGDGEDEMGSCLCVCMCVCACARACMSASHIQRLFTNNVLCCCVLS